MKIRCLKILFLFVLTVVVHISKGQDFTYISGARMKALAEHSTTFADHWSAINNQAGLAFITSFATGVYVENRFNMRELNSGTVTIAIPTGGKSALGFSVYSFNQSVIFSRQKFGLGYGLRLTPNFSAGINLNLIRTSIEDIGNNLSFCGEIGILYHLSDKIHIGVHLFNPTANKYSNYGGERIPSMMRIGLGYRAGEKTLLLAEIDNTSLAGFGFKGAFEHYLNERLSIQAGVISRNWVSSFGLRYDMKNFSINVCVVFHQVLDSSPGITLDYFSKQ